MNWNNWIEGVYSNDVEQVSMQCYSYKRALGLPRPHSVTCLGQEDLDIMRIRAESALKADADNEPLNLKNIIPTQVPYHEYVSNKDKGIRSNGSSTVTMYSKADLKLFSVEIEISKLQGGFKTEEKEIEKAILK